MTIELALYLGTAAIAVGIPLVYIWSYARANRKAQREWEKAHQRGLDEPISLHPYIDPDVCIGTGACVKACPEDRVLAIIDNRAQLVNATRCIGHGLCAQACPVEAITLVFGTARRGVDLPYLKGNFESNIPGLYIAGELGGMGLIRNAIIQGMQAAHNIAQSLKSSPKEPGVYDLIIVGAGPAGIGASLQAKAEGLNFLTFDQEDLGGTILTYPRRKLVMTQPIDLPLYGRLEVREITKEELLSLFQNVFERVGLRVNGEEKVEDIRALSSHFQVVTTRGEYLSQRVLLAIGRRGSPRKLGVPGEKSSKVSYRLLDPEKFHEMSILVVGGGDSAVESALALSEQPGNRVAISYRRESFFRLKEGNERRIHAAIREGKVHTLFNSQVMEIKPESVVLEQEGKIRELENDYVFVMIGGELPVDFLKKVGIALTKKYEEPL